MSPLQRQQAVFITGPSLQLLDMVLISPCAHIFLIYFDKFLCDSFSSVAASYLSGYASWVVQGRHIVSSTSRNKENHPASVFALKTELSATDKMELPWIRHSGKVTVPNNVECLLGRA